MNSVKIAIRSQCPHHLPASCFACSSSWRRKHFDSSDSGPSFGCTALCIPSTSFCRRSRICLSPSDDSILSIGRGGIWHFGKVTPFGYSLIESFFSVARCSLPSCEDLSSPFPPSFSVQPSPTPLLRWLPRPWRHRGPLFLDVFSLHWRSWDGPITWSSACSMHKLIVPCPSQGIGHTFASLPTAHASIALTLLPSSPTRVWGPWSYPSNLPSTFHISTSLPALVNWGHWYSKPGPLFPPEANFSRQQGLHTLD